MDDLHLRGDDLMKPFLTDTAAALELNVPGAHVGADGVRYCVWAPLHDRLQVRVQRSGSRDVADIPLERQESGYFTVEDPQGRPGDRYLFVLADGSELPDPASRFQPEGVHRWSECVDSGSYDWKCRSHRACPPPTFWS